MEVVVGTCVFYFDEHGKQHQALITAVWGDPANKPSLNLVIVDDDETKTDTYGRQIKRTTSVVHKDNQPAHGRYWLPLS